MLPDEKPEVTATGSKSPLQGLSSAQVPSAKLTEHLLVVRAERVAVVGLSKCLRVESPVKTLISRRKCVFFPGPYDRGRGQTRKFGQGNTREPLQR